MQRAIKGEVSSINKLQFEKNGGDNVSAHTSGHDVEKAAIKTEDAPATTETGVQTPNVSSQKGIFAADRVPESDASTLAADEEKDDFPEGGLRGWSVVIGR